MIGVWQEAEDRAKEEEAASVLASKGGKKGSQTPRPVDTDPHGDKLIMVRKFLPDFPSYFVLSFVQWWMPNHCTHYIQ
jgi:peptide alpha-N-acetyltransferase